MGRKRRNILTEFQDFDQEEFTKECTELDVRPIQGVSREQWGAREPIHSIPMYLPVNTVMVTWTKTKPCNSTEECTRAVNRLQEKHMLKGYDDIKHSFVIGGDSHVYEGRGWDREPEKVKQYSKLHGDSINIAIMWQKEKNPPWQDPTLNIVVRHNLRREYLTPQPPPDVMHTMFDVIEYGIKNNYIVQEHAMYYLRSGAVSDMSPRFRKRSRHK